MRGEWIVVYLIVEKSRTPLAVQPVNKREFGPHRCSGASNGGPWYKGWEERAVMSVASHDPSLATQEKGISGVAQPALAQHQTSISTLKIRPDIPRSTVQS
jgi:hypothetical protein